MLTASVVTYNTPEDELAACLASLSPDYFDKIFIIDNSKSEITRKQCQDRHGITYIPSDNVGYGRAHNIAITKAMQLGSEYHLVINPDVYFTPSEIKKMLDYMRQNHDVATLQPAMIHPNGSPQYTVKKLPAPTDLIIRRFCPSKWFKKRNARYELRHIDHSKPFNVPYHQGSFMLLRTSAIREVGMFDERFFMYPEDIDLTRRLHSRYRTMYYPYATVTHAHRAASYHSMRMLGIHIINMVRYFNKWGWWHDEERRRYNAPFH
ncbi:MAG: glycosyltransferase [Paramuribaculum sp.]|nr:glycosyltransferase [Paramuribaculum sp.]